MKTHSRSFAAWFFVVAYAGFIFFLSSMPRPFPEPIQRYLPDWILHGVEYGVFGFLLIRALYFSSAKRSMPFLFLMAWSLGVLYGVSDEWHQRFVPAREPSAQDVAADGLGVFLGAFVWVKRNRDAGS